jgi:hypothetical protein|tara:strand:+ start:7312 stop:7968 length:657 start_codon:yes stop_codon:yes gene_type:complete
MIKISILIFSLLFSISCSNSGIYRELGQSILDAFNYDEDIPSSEVMKIPYASMQLRVGTTPYTLIILEEEKDNVLKWTSSNLIKIYTLNGKIIRFTGFQNELTELELDPKHPLLNKNYKVFENEIYTSFYTFRNPNLFRLPVKTKFKILEEETLSILDEDIETFILEEKSEKNLINWEFTNLYWISIKDNEVVKSRQVFTPKNPEVDYTILKKYKKSP